MVDLSLSCRHVLVDSMPCCAPTLNENSLLILVCRNGGMPFCGMAELSLEDGDAIRRAADATGHIERRTGDEELPALFPLAHGR